MSSKKIITSIQNFFKISNIELFVAALVVSGLLIGVLTQERNENRNKMLASALDSLAEAHQTTYTGIDNEGNVNKDLAEADTIVEEKVMFPKKEEDDKESDSDSDELINLNTASKVELMELHGVGPKTAEKIINYREKQEFEKIEDIKKVKGIGPKTFEDLKDKITI